MTHTTTITACRQQAVKKPRRPREIRDPYDGLRPWSALTHGVGAVLALVGTIFLVGHSILRKDWAGGVTFFVYGLSMIGLYTASTLYHSVNTTVAGRLALRKLDHCTIYLLIAGSYTPVCMTVLRQDGGTLLCAVIWGLAIGGMILTLAKLEIPRWLASTIYLVMGWLALVAIVPLSRRMPLEGMIWLVLGGLFYSVGGVLYAVKWPGRSNPRFGCHEIFHVFILLGSLFHFLMMYRVIA